MALRDNTWGDWHWLSSVFPLKCVELVGWQVAVVYPMVPPMGWIEPLTQQLTMCDEVMRCFRLHPTGQTTLLTFQVMYREVGLICHLYFEFLKQQKCVSAFNCGDLHSLSFNHRSLKQQNNKTGTVAVTSPGRP